MRPLRSYSYVAHTYVPPVTWMRPMVTTCCLKRVISSPDMGITKSRPLAIANCYISIAECTHKRMFQ